MSTEPLAACGAASTVAGMPSEKRSPVVARFEIISDHPAAGEAYRHTVTVQRNGRVRSVVTCAEREETVQEWVADQPPTLEELADLLIVACYDDYHESRIRLLSAVAHGLLPQGNHLWEATAKIPDAVLDASLGFGHCTTYRAEIQNALADVLRGRPGTTWALQVQTAGTAEHDEFVGQIDEASTADPEWLRRSLDASRSGTGVPFDDLITRSTPVTTHTSACSCGKLRAEMTDHTRKIAWVGTYHTDAGMGDTEVLVMADSAYTAILRHNTIASGARSGAESWSTLVAQFGREEVEEVLGPVIRDLQHLLGDEDLGGSDEAVQKYLDAAKESDMWPYAYQPFDDADVILAGLPTAVVEMVRPQSVSPMTNYSPCVWNSEDLPRIRALLEEAGWEVCPTDFHPAWP